MSNAARITLFAASVATAFFSGYWYGEPAATAAALDGNRAAYTRVVNGDHRSPVRGSAAPTTPASQTDPARSAPGVSVTDAR